MVQISFRSGLRKLRLKISMNIFCNQHRSIGLVPKPAKVRTKSLMSAKFCERNVSCVAW